MLESREGSLPFSHRRLCRLPSLPFNSASRRAMLSRREGGREGGLRGGVTSSSKLTVRVTPSAVSVCAKVAVFAGFERTYSSMGIVKGDPTPRAAGETLSDCRADIVHASISIPVYSEAGADCSCAAGASCDGCVPGGGGVALKMAIDQGWAVVAAAHTRNIHVATAIGKSKSRR